MEWRKERKRDGERKREINEKRKKEETMEWANLSRNERQTERTNESLR